MASTTMPSDRSSADAGGTRPATIFHFIDQFDGVIPGFGHFFHPPSAGA
jgi:hypothetical protein